MFARVARVDVLGEFGSKLPGFAEQHVGEVFRVILVIYRLTIYRRVGGLKVPFRRFELGSKFLSGI